MQRGDEDDILLPCNGKGSAVDDDAEADKESNAVVNLLYDTDDDDDPPAAKPNSVVLFTLPCSKGGNFDEIIAQHLMNCLTSLPGFKQGHGFRQKALSNTPSPSSEGRRGRYFVSVYPSDMKLLDPHEKPMITDCIVNAIIVWMMSLASSTCLVNKRKYENKKFHIFNTHLFATLREEGGVQAAIKTVKKNIKKQKIDNIFDYDLLLFPIHMRTHWSLYVVTNCKFIANRNTRDPFPGCIHLDSIASPYGHNATYVGGKVSDFLDGLWNEVMGATNSITRPFTRLPCVIPRVTEQEGGTECGFYLIMFMSAIIATRDRPFSEHDFQFDMLTRITGNESFKNIHTETVDKLRVELKLAFLFLEEQNRKNWNTGVLDPYPQRNNKHLKTKQNGEKLKRRTGVAKAKHGEPSKTGTQEAIKETNVNNVNSRSDFGLSKEDGLRLLAAKKQSERRGKFYWTELKKRGMRDQYHTIAVTYLDWTSYPAVKWKDGIQLSLDASSIPVYGSRGKVEIFGIIVRRKREIDDSPFSVYELVDMNLIMRSLEVRCDGGIYSYTQLTGTFRPYGAGSVPVTLVKWEKESPKWVCRAEPLKTNDVRSRKRATDQLVASMSTATRTDTRANFCKETTANKIYGHNFVNGGQLEARDRKIQHHLKYADVCKAMAEAQKLCGRSRSDETGEITGAIQQRQESQYKSLSGDHIRNESIKLSLLFEIISGKRGSSGIISGNKVAYLEVVQNKNLNCGKRKQATYTDMQYHNKRPPCKHRGCSTLSHKTCKGYCAKHKQHQNLCTKCHKRRQERAGGICSRCFKFEYPDPESLRQAKMCIDCKVKESRRIGGRCTGCYAAQAPWNKKQKFWNQMKVS